MQQYVCSFWCYQNCIHNDWISLLFHNRKNHFCQILTIKTYVKSLTMAHRERCARWMICIRNDTLECHLLVIFFFCFHMSYLQTTATSARELFQIEFYDAVRRTNWHAVDTLHDNIYHARKYAPESKNFTTREKWYSEGPLLVVTVRWVVLATFHRLIGIIYD